MAWLLPAFVVSEKSAWMWNEANSGTKSLAAGERPVIPKLNVTGPNLNATDCLSMAHPFSFQFPDGCLVRLSFSPPGERSRHLQPMVNSKA